MYRAYLIVPFFFLIISSALYAGGTVESTPSDSIETKNPTIALAVSAVFPGGGQIYAESYVHGSAFVLLNGYLLYKIFSKDSEFNDIQDDLALNPGDEELLNRAESVRDSRNLHIWLWSAAYILNLMDAYSEATLYNFDKRMDMKVDGGVLPNGGHPVPAVSLTLEF